MRRLRLESKFLLQLELVLVLQSALEQLRKALAFDEHEAETREGEAF